MKIRIALAAFAGLVMLGGAGAAVATSSTASAVTQTAASTTYSPPRCHVGDLAAGFHGYQIEMGTRGFLLTLTNVSNHSCSLYGFPGLQLLDAQKRPLPTKTLWGMSYFDRNQAKSLIVLSPGETASADISFGVYGTRANSVLAYYMEVTPPNCYGHFIVKIPYGPALVYLHQVQVTPMARHTPYIP